MQYKNISYITYALGAFLTLGACTILWTDYSYAQDIPPIPQTSTENECTQTEKDARQGYQQCYTFVKKDGQCKCEFNGTLYDLQNASTAEMLSLILRFISILMRPLMAIGGYAMDNALVYGEIFHMDVALYQFWNMIKNLANYFLAFFFIWKVLQGVRSGGDLISTIPGLLKKTIVAAVGIQISRWVIGALLDLSTILTYGVGAIPLTVIRGNESIDQPILATHTSYKLSDISDASNNQDETLIYYSYGNEKYIQCSFAKRTISPSSTTPGSQTTSIRSFVPKNDAQGIIGRNTYFTGKVAAIIAGFNAAQNQINTQAAPLTIDMFKIEYCVDNGKLLGYYEPTASITTKQPGSNGSPIPIDLNNIYVYKAVYEAGTTHLKNIYAQKSDTAVCGTEGVQCKTLSDIIEAGKGMTGPLYTIYGSILNFGNLAISTDNKTVYSLTLEFIIKAVFSVALVLPLLFICVMLIARALLMWILIAFSPMLAIFYAFGGEDGISNKINNNEHIKGVFEKGIFSGALSLIFMPVIAVMAISLGLAFMQIMSSMMLQEPQDFLEGFGIEKQGQGCHSMPGVFSVCGAPNNTGDDGFSIFTNHFNRFVINLLAVGIMRSVMMAILKSVGIFTNLINETTNMATSILRSAPIIPLPSGATSIEGLNKGMDKVGAHYTNEINNYNDEKGKELLKKIGYETDQYGNIINKDDISEKSQNSVISTMPTLDKSDIKDQTGSASYQIAKNNRGTDYEQTANMNKDLQTMGSNIDKILGEIHNTQEGAQTIEQMGKGYEKWTGVKLARKENGLIDHQDLATGLKSPEFRTKLAESMYRQSYSKSAIDSLLNTLGDVTNDQGQPLSLQKKFWSEKASELNERYQEHNGTNPKAGSTPIIFSDLGGHKYLYEKGTNAQDIVITNTTFSGGKIDAIDNIYHFKNSDSMAEFGVESKVSIKSLQDLQYAADLVSDMIQNGNTIDDTYFSSGKTLYLFRENIVKAIIDKIAKKTSGTIQTSDGTSYVLSYENGKAIFKKG